MLAVARQAREISDSGLPLSIKVQLAVVLLYWLKCRNVLLKSLSTTYVLTRHYASQYKKVFIERWVNWRRVFFAFVLDLEKTSYLRTPALYNCF